MKRDIIHRDHHAATPLILGILKSDCIQLCREIMWQLKLKGRKPSPEAVSKIKPNLEKKKCTCLHELYK